MRTFFRTPTGRIALGSVLAAGSLAVLMLACISPIGQMGVTAMAGLFPMIGVLVAGRVVGYLCWAAAAILGFLLLPDKAVVLLYLVFLGLYPVLKECIESVRMLPLEWMLKLVYFNLALTLVWFVFQAWFLPMLPEWTDGVLYGLGNLIFVCYDIGLSRLIALIRVKLRLY